MGRTVLRVSSLVLAMAATAFAGCLDEAAPPLEALDATAADAAKAAFTFSSEGCWEGGFQAIYGGQPLYADTWQTADVREEYGGGGDSPSFANVHQGIKCETATWNGQVLNDFVFGYVGDPIVAPAFDVGGADWHVLLSFVSLQPSAFYDGLDAVTTARISEAKESRIDYLAGDQTTPQFATYVIFETLDNGIYESYSNMEKYRDVAPRTIRLWWTVPADGSESMIGAHNGEDSEHAAPEGMKWNPVYFDIKTTGGEQYSTPKQGGVEVACHAGIDDHGPQGRLCQPTHTSIYEHGAMEFSFGRVFKDVVINDYWFH